MTKRILGAALAALVFGCTTDNRNSALSITQVTLGTATTVTAADGSVSISCTFSASSIETELPLFASNGVNNLGAAGFVVRNQLTIPTTVNADFNTDTTTFSPHQAVVDYEIIGGTQTIAEQIIPVSGSPVSAGGSQAVIVPLFLPTAALTALRAVPAAGAVVRTSVRIEGKLDDGSTVSTSEHEYVVAISSAATDPVTGKTQTGSNSPCF